MRNRCVLHVIPFLWSGAGRVVTRLCEEQTKGAEVHIATTGRLGTERDWPAYRRRLAKAGVTWHRLNTFDRRPESLWPTVARAGDLIAQLRPDVVHAHAGVPALVTTLAVRPSSFHLRAKRVGEQVVPRPSSLRPSPRRLSSLSHGPRVIGQMYSWGPNRPAWMDTMDLIGFGRVDSVVVSARKYEQLLIEGGVDKSRLTYVPWGVDLDAGLKPRRHVSSSSEVRGGEALAPRSSNGRITLGFIGRIEPRKDQLTLVDALGDLVSQGVDAELVLVGPDGDAAYGAAVRDRIRELNLGERVRVTGAVRSIRPHLASMDAFVSLSKDEGQGLAVLEAMGAGVPVLARPAGGLEDFVADGRNGQWLNGTTGHALGGQLAAALADSKRLARMATRARVMVNDRYTWTATLRTLETLYGW